jgi:anti-anti-sigma factor
MWHESISAPSWHFMANSRLGSLWRWGKCLVDLIFESRPDLKLEINLAEVQYIDSVCIGVLVTAGRRLGESGGSLALLNPLAPVRKVLEKNGRIWVSSS